MKKAIEFLTAKGITVFEDGKILGEFPDGLEGVALLDDLQSETTTDEGEWTVINDQITFQEY